MVDRQVEFLNLECALGWDADAEIAERREFSAAFTCEAEDLESPCPRDFGGGTDIGCVAGSREPHKQAAGSAECHDELRKLQPRIDVVRHSGAQRGKASERDAGNGLLEFIGKLRAQTRAQLLSKRAAGLESFHEFPCPMIRIGRAATIAGNERVAAVTEAFEKQIGGLADLCCVRRKLGAALQQFGKMVAAGWCGVHNFSNGRFHRGGEGLQVADRFAEFGRDDAAGCDEFGQGFGMKFAQECGLELMAGTHEKRTEHDDLRVE